MPRREPGILRTRRALACFAAARWFAGRAITCAPEVGRRHVGPAVPQLLRDDLTDMSIRIPAGMAGAGHDRGQVAAIGSVEDRLNRKINPTLYTREEFERRRREGNSFLARVPGGEHIVLIGADSGP